MAQAIIPAFILANFLYGAVKKVPVFDAFIEGAKEALALVKNILPYIMAVLIMMSLLKTSGLSTMLGRALSPAMRFVGVPQELSELIILRPFSGSGSIALLEGVYRDYGADSYVARCASVIVGSSETVFYVGALYVSDIKTKKLRCAMPVALFATFAGTVISCLLCRLM